MKAFILAAIAILCFIPIVNVPTVEEYNTLEPYTVSASTSVPDTFFEERAEWVDDGSWDRAKNYVPFTVEEAMDVFHSVTPGKWVLRQSEVTRYRTETRKVVRYRLVARTRIVMQRVPIIIGLFR